MWDDLLREFERAQWFAFLGMLLAVVLIPFAFFVMIIWHSVLAPLVTTDNLIILAGLIVGFIVGLFL